MTLLLFSEP
jgi:hypothetical protein